MEDNGRESDHLMLITPERVFYAGLLGRPRKRTPGCCHVYVAVKGSLHLTIDDVLATGELFASPDPIGPPMPARSSPPTRCCASAAITTSPPPNSTRCALARRCRVACSIRA